MATLGSGGAGGDIPCRETHDKADSEILFSR